MSSLRPLAKPQIPLPSAKPAGEPPRLAFIPLSKLRIDDTYQRRIERRGLKTIERIVSEFDWNRFAPLIVAPLQGGLYAIIDGQHRATAALLRGFDKVPCAIVHASAAEQPGIFAAVNGDVTPITIFQMFKAARAANQEWALDIDRACAAAGIVPLVYPKGRGEIKPFETMAIGTLRQFIIRFGVAEVAAALKAAVKHHGADEPGFWNSAAIKMAVSDWRIAQGKRPDMDPSASSLAQRIRELRAKGHSRFAIQAALRVKLADIEEAIRGGA
ncbi:MAG TPA: ParB N-terminal domain-containing protein [Magnetospirillum sp.]|nr:ParB N-terminal domain-containing protein [Magnetospirillum sp.]